MWQSVHILGEDKSDATANDFKTAKLFIFSNHNDGKNIFTILQQWREIIFSLAKVNEVGW